MAEQLILKILPFIRVLTSRAQEFSYKYLSKTTNLCIIHHGKTMDYLPHKLNEGVFNFVKMAASLWRAMRVMTWYSTSCFFSTLYLDFVEFR